MAGKYDALIAEVNENKDIVASVKQTLDTLRADLIAAQNDPAALAEIVAALDEQNADLAAAAANVPADEEPVQTTTTEEPAQATTTEEPA